MAAAQTAVADTDAAGAFRRQPAVFRERVSATGRYPPEAGRYVLYVSLACPWASRCVALLYAKGLEEAIQLVVVHPTWARTRPGQDDHCGWQFRAATDAPVANPAGLGSFSCEG